MQGRLPHATLSAAACRICIVESPGRVVVAPKETKGRCEADPAQLDHEGDHTSENARAVTAKASHQQDLSA